MLTVLVSTISNSQVFKLKKCEKLLQMQKLLAFFISKNISVYAIFNDQSFNNALSNDMVSFEQLGSGLQKSTDFCGKWLLLHENIFRAYLTFRVYLTFTTLWADSEKTNWWYISYFSQTTGFDISCKLETICIKCQNLFSGKDRINISVFHLLKILPRVLSVKI